MDEFYRIENIEIFRKWAYFQVLKDPRLTIEKYDERTYKVFYKKRVARLVIWPIGIIEEAINEDDQLLFYLHYQFHSYLFAVDLFHRMIDKLTEEQKERKQVLLCCTGGMTTGFFAEKMNKFCKLNKLPYDIQATAIYNLEKIYQKYDLILIAPQLRYKEAQLSQKLKPVKVQSIGPGVFATYNCQALLDQIQNFYKSEVKS